MFIVRFRGVPAAGESAQVRAAPDAVSYIDFFASEAATDNTLRSADDCIVVRCSAESARIEILSSVASPEGGQPVGARIDRIASSDVYARAAAEGADRGGGSFRLLGHFEQLGDATAEPGSWLGDPRESRRLEGFSIHWNNQPEGVDIASTVIIGHLGRTPVVLSGGFCGTRGRSEPITSLTLALVGERANDYVLAIQAQFDRTPMQRAGAGVELRGVTGREPLVALRLDVIKRA